MIDSKDIRQVGAQGRHGMADGAKPQQENVHTGTGYIPASTTELRHG